MKQIFLLSLWCRALSRIRQPQSPWSRRMLPGCRESANIQPRRKNQIPCEKRRGKKHRKGGRAISVCHNRRWGEWRTLMHAYGSPLSTELQRQWERHVRRHAWNPGYRNHISPKGDAEIQIFDMITPKYITWILHDVYLRLSRQTTQGFLLRCNPIQLCCFALLLFFPFLALWGACWEALSFSLSCSFHEFSYRTYSCHSYYQWWVPI
jgi:hypothetical protein